MAEDIWSHWPKEQKPNFALAEGAPTSILLAPWPELPTAWVLPAEKEKAFEALLMLRETVNAGLEQARSQEEIGSSLEASILIQPLSPTWQFVQALDENLLETIFLVSGVEVLTSTTNVYTEYAVLAEEEVDGEYKVYVIRATGDKCQRCWQYKETVGAYVDHPSLCTRCHHAVLD
jgi:isoleucyl-tRNA synthetase